MMKLHQLEEAICKGTLANYVKNVQVSDTALGYRVLEYRALDN